MEEFFQLRYNLISGSLNMNYKYSSSNLGGTFDHLHAGHKHFFDTAFASSEHVTIGLTTPVLFGHKLLSENIESYEIRLKDLENYLKEKNYDKRSKIIKLTDIYGNTLTEKNIDAIFINEHGLKNAQIINEKRKKLGLNTLEIINVPLINGDDEKVISSSRIRSGKIDRDGHSYLKFLQTKNLKLNDNLRDQLKIPLGDIIENIEDFKKESFFITVGDMTTSNFICMGIIPDISIFDGKTGRSKIVDENILEYLPKEYVEIENPAGSISSKSIQQIFQAIRDLVFEKKKSSIKIIGEEDLLTLPLILLAPLNSVIAYGQPNKGVVLVNVTEEKKREIKKLLEKMKVSN